MTTDAMATASTSWLRPLRWFEPSVNTAPGAEQVTAGRFSLPVGTVTFLLTDVEGSTRAWEATPEAMGEAIARHYAILDAAVSAHGGVRPQEQGEGDSIVAAFGRASDALRAAADAQRGLAEEAERVQPVGLASPLRVRMAVHTGEAQMRDEANYVGQAIIRTARLRAIAHGGQVLVSQAVRDLVVDQLGDRVELLDLGVHRLKDLARPEHVWQLAGSGMEREFPPLKSLDALPNNLPIELSTFIGRHAEIEELCGLLATNRVVTVTGAGGSGKTRLAQQVAAQLSDGYPDGTWWVELAPVGTDAVRGMIAAAVSVVEPDRLVERLAGRMLLVLDNCEHVLAVVAALVQQIVAKCPEVSVLATSRGPLDVPGERTWRVPPLPAPVVGEHVPIEGLRQFDAVRLFVDRAQRARPNFALTTANGPAVAELCARLDGIPLAIELAAARVKSLTPKQILGGLEDALRLLTGGSRLVLPRQRTLEASIGWSHDLLAERDRTLFRRLAVFAGGWDLDAAEAVCTDADDRDLDVQAVLDGLERLIDQSLIRVDERDGVARYALLETVRQFAARQLEAHVDERDALRTRHVSWFAGLAGAIGPLVEGPDEHACVARLSPERNNLSVALHHLLDTGNPGALAEMTLACGPFWNSADTPAEGRNWTTTALDGVIDEPLRVRLLGARAMHVFLIGNMYEVLSEARAVLVPAEAIGDRRTAGRARALEACAARFTDVDQAVDQFDRAAEDCRTAGDRFGEAHALCQKASLCAFRGLRRTAQELATAGGVVAALANPSLCAWHNDSLATLSLRTADHAGMRAALQPLGAREVHAMPLRCALDLMIRADHGDELPDPDPIAARVLVLERAENFRDAMMLNMALMQLLRLADASERGQAVADDAARRMPMLPRWHLDGALFALALGDPEGARERLARAVPLPGDVELRLFIAASMISALIARHDRDFTKAEAAAHVALSLAVEHEHARETLDALEVLAGIAAAHGSWQLTARLAGAAQERRDCHPLKARTEPIRSMLTADLTVSRNALGEPAFQKAFDEGRLLSGDDAVAYAQRARGERSRPTIGWASLTPTERRVVDLARHGLTNGDIAAELLMGAETVKTHLSRLRKACRGEPDPARCAATTERHIHCFHHCHHGAIMNASQSRRSIVVFTATIACFAMTVFASAPSVAATRKATATKAKPKTTVVASTTSPPTTAVSRGKLVVGAGGEIPGLDPAAVARDITSDAVSNAIYDALLDVPFGKPPRPALARSVTEAPDRRSWTITIRDDVRFHDGTPLTADAVKLNLERQRKSRLNGASMALIKSIDVTGPLTLTLTVDKPYGSMPFLLGGTTGIMLSPKAIQEKADKLNREPTDAGTGPYILKEFVTGDHSTVVRNPNYWGDPKPRLDQIIFRVIPDEGARLAALRAGDVQSIVTLFPSTVNRAREAGFAIVEPPFGGSAAIFLNNSKPPFDDVRIRRAASLAIDRPAVSAVFEDPNVGKQGFGLWPKGNPWYLADGDAQPYDRAEARRLVSAYVKETGRDVSFTYLLPNANGVSLDGSRLIVRYLQDAGMDVTVQNLPDVNQLLGAIFSGQYQAAAWLVGLPTDPDATAYPVLYSTSPANFERYKSVEMDAALDAGRAASDPAARKAAYNDVQRIFRKDIPFIVSSPGTSNLISDKKVCGLDITGGFTAKTVGLGNC